MNRFLGRLDLYILIYIIGIDFEGLDLERKISSLVRILFHTISNAITHFASNVTKDVRAWVLDMQSFNFKI